MYDITPNNPVTVTDGISVTCSNIDDVVPIGSEYLRHAFIVLQDADITVKNAGGTTLVRGTDYFTIARAMDNVYSKQYSTSIYSGLKFKETGTYAVTSFITCGTYPRAGWFNYLFEEFLTLRDVTVAALSSAVSSLSTNLNNMISEVQTIASGLSAEISDRATADLTLQSHIDTESTTRASADTTLANSLASHVDNTTDAHGAVSTATANKHMVRDANARVQIAAGSADADAVNKGQMDTALAALALSVGTGNVTTSDTSSTDGEIVVKSGTGGNAVKGGGTLLSAILSAITTLQGYFTGGVANNSSALSGIAISLIPHLGQTMTTQKSCQTTSSSSLDSCVATGWYHVLPTEIGAYGQCIHLQSDTVGFARQIFFIQGGLGVYYRVTANRGSNSWSSWAQITNATGAPVQPYVPTSYSYPSRALGTTYTNTTGKTMHVYVTVSVTTSGAFLGCYAKVNGYSVAYTKGDGLSTTATRYRSIYFVVPPGCAYYVTNSSYSSTSLFMWTEIY